MNFGGSFLTKLYAAYMSHVNKTAKIIFSKQIIQLYVLQINTTNYRGESFTLLIKGYTDYLNFNYLGALLIQ